MRLANAFAKGGGRDVHPGSESVMKAGNGTEPDITNDRIDGPIGTAQEELGTLHTAGVEILIESLPGLSAKTASELGT
jgi:hypothetical protein